MISRPTHRDGAKIKDPDEDAKAFARQFIQDRALFDEDDGL